MKLQNHFLKHTLKSHYLYIISGEKDHKKYNGVTRKLSTGSCECIVNMMVGSSHRYEYCKIWQVYNETPRRSAWCVKKLSAVNASNEFHAWMRENPFFSVPNARKRTKGSVTEYPHYNMKLGQDRSWKLVQNPIIFSTFFGENIKFDFLTSGKISKTGSRLSMWWSCPNFNMINSNRVKNFFLINIRNLQNLEIFKALRRPRYWFSAKTTMISGLSDQKICKKHLFQLNLEKSHIMSSPIFR